jgi:hypothetical protein
MIGQQVSVIDHDRKPVVEPTVVEGAELSTKAPGVGAERPTQQP